MCKTRGEWCPFQKISHGISCGVVTFAAICSVSLELSVHAVGKILCGQKSVFALQNFVLKVVFYVELKKGLFEDWCVNVMTK
jgi:hypothetical protein